jgi:hypothetical protein
MTYGWLWTGKDSDGRPVSRMGFAQRKWLAHNRIASSSAWLTKRPMRGMRDFVEDWKPGGFVIHEEIVETEIVDTTAVGHARSASKKSVNEGGGAQRIRRQQR